VSQSTARAQEITASENVLLFRKLEMFYHLILQNYEIGTCITVIVKDTTFEAHCVCRNTDIELPLQ